MSKVFPSLVSISMPQYNCLVIFAEKLVGAADEILTIKTKNKSPVADTKELLQLVPSEMLMDKPIVSLYLVCLMVFKFSSYFSKLLLLLCLIWRKYHEAG